MGDSVDDDAPADCDVEDFCAPEDGANEVLRGPASEVLPLSV